MNTNDPQTPYGAPPQFGTPQYGPAPEDGSVMSVKAWAITYLITIIPCVGIIMLFVWAFGTGGNLNRRNYARAVLLVGAIGIGIYFVVMVGMLAILGVNSIRF